jgi:putative endonuclease
MGTARCQFIANLFLKLLSSQLQLCPSFKELLLSCTLDGRAGHTTVLYTGVTSNLSERIFEHISKKHPKSFTAKYNINKLVYFESFPRIEEAINREKKIKGGSRKNKEKLINDMNPDWKDLYPSIAGAY